MPIMVTFGESRSNHIQEGMICSAEWASKFVANAARFVPLTERRLGDSRDLTCCHLTSIEITYGQTETADTIRLNMGIIRSMATEADPIGMYLRRVKAVLHGMPHPPTCAPLLIEGTLCPCGEKRVAVDNVLRCWLHNWKGLPKQGAVP